MVRLGFFISKAECGTTDSTWTQPYTVSTTRNLSVFIMLEYFIACNFCKVIHHEFSECCTVDTLFIHALC